jgi:RNA polymerase sigma factor (sigma-70 family)
MSAAITLDDDASQRAQRAVTEGQPRLGPAQERILAELVHSAQQSAPGLRFAAVPIAELHDLPIFGGLAASWRRSQVHLRGAVREWDRRARKPRALSAAAEAVINENVPKDQASTLRALSPVEAGEPTGGLLSALALDRSLIGDTRTGLAAQAFISELDRQLHAFERAYPATLLEQLDIKRAQRLARDHFIRAGLHLASRRARAVAWRSRLPLADLVQIGAEGLIHAVDRFDPSYGAPFAAYAIWWIKQAVARGERSADLMPLPQRLQAARGCIRRAAARALADGSAATSIAIANRVGLPERVVEAVTRANDPVVSLDGVAGLIVKETSADGDAVSAHDRVHMEQRRHAVRLALATVRPRERAVLELLFGIGCTPMTPLMIARKLGITRQRVSQIYHEEIRRLRRPPVLLLLKDYA